MPCDRWHRILALLVLTAPALPAAAQDYPNRPIRAIASQGAGRLERHLHARARRRARPGARRRRIVVEDRVGAAGTIGARACAEAAPDGYTICILPPRRWSSIR